MGASLLETKLHRPPIRLEIVARPHLIARLNQGLEPAVRLTLLSAPAGAGKTTLVSGWLDCLDRPAAWLSLDEEDSDPARFLAYFVSALQQLEPGVGETSLGLLQAQPSSPPELWLGALLNDLAALRRPAVMVLDDYQTIRSLAVHRSLAYLLDRLPPSLHLVILSREDPPLPIPRWRARGQVNEFHLADLRFSEVEAAAFLHGSMGLALSEEDMASLQQRTEGWIVGLQLAALSLQGQADPASFIRAFSGSSRYILDYLVEEILSQQSAEVRQFLLHSAILDRLSGPLCDAVVGRSGSQALLESLEQANLFLMPLDQSRGWYRYHRLFAEFLRHQLRLADPECEPELHRLAGRWYEAHGYLDEALQHVLAAGLWAESEQLIALAAGEAIASGRNASLSRWLEMIPEAAVRQSSQLASLKGWALLSAGQLEAAGLYAGLAASRMPLDTPPADRAVLAALDAYLALAQGDKASAARKAQETLDLTAAADPYFVRAAALSCLAQAQTMSGDITSAVATWQEQIRLCQATGRHLAAVAPQSAMAYLLQLQGRRRQALALARRAVEQCQDRQGRPLALAAPAHVILGLLHYEADELAAARARLERGLVLGDQLGPGSGVPHSARVALLRLNLALGDTAAAWQSLDELRQLGARFDLAHLQQLIAGLEAELYLKEGNLKAVAAWAAAAGLSPNARPSHAREPDFFTYTRLLLRQGRPEQALTLLEALEHFAQDTGRGRSVLTVRLLQGLAHQALGRPAEALACLETAVRLAAPEEYRRAFLDEDRRLLDLLPQARPAAPAFVDQLLGAARPKSPAAGAELGPGAALDDRRLLEPLSVRELEVLRLIVAGLTNQEIAAALVVTVGTVKSHAHHIYEKLGVNGRPQAMIRARDLGLV